MPTEFLPLDKIIVNRDLAPEDDLSELKLSIETDGL